MVVDRNFLTKYRDDNPVTFEVLGDFQFSSWGPQPSCITELSTFWPNLCKDVVVRYFLTKFHADGSLNLEVVSDFGISR
jgi:hypothetical protein